MTQLFIAFCLAVFWTCMYVLACVVFPWLPKLLIDVVFVAVFCAAFTAMALCWIGKEGER